MTPAPPPSRHDWFRFQHPDSIVEELGAYLDSVGFKPIPTAPASEEEEEAKAKKIEIVSKKKKGRSSSAKKSYRRRRYR